MKRHFLQTVFLLIALLAGTSAKAVVTKDDISLSLSGISTQLRGSYSDISEYVEGSGKSFTVTGRDLYVKGRLYNETSQSIELNTSRILVAFVQGDSPYTSESYNLDGTKLSSIFISGRSFTDVIIKIPENFRIINGLLHLYFVYADGAGGYFSTFCYNVSSSNSIKTKSAVSTLETSLAQDVYVQPIEVSRNYNGPYEDIMQYRPYTGKYYYMGYEDLNVKFSIKNKTSAPITLMSNLFSISYGTQNIYRVLSVADESNNQISTFTIPANSTIKVIFHLGNEWYDNRENANYPDRYQPVSLYLYYNGTKTDGISYSYLFTRTLAKSVSVNPTTVTSDVTVKSTDDASIKSIRVVGFMGDLVTAKSYGNNCTEANLDLSNCKKGIYYIQVEKTNGVETTKVIKK